MPPPRGFGDWSWQVPPRSRELRPSRDEEAGPKPVLGAEEVKVVVRVRPPLDPERVLSYYVDDVDPTKLLSTQAEVAAVPPGASPKNLSVEEFTFSRVIGPTEDNGSTFKDLSFHSMIGGVVDGYQETVFAYGQTGSGKTHTILGSAGGEPGLLQLCTSELFSSVFGGDFAVPNMRRCIQLMCLEIKNEAIADLLPEAAAPGAWTDGPVLNGGPHVVPQVARETMVVKGRRYAYSKVTVWSYEETMWLLRHAVASREVGSSSVNSESSRSHMVVRFLVRCFGDPADGDGGGSLGTLTLVDLAGNERESPNDSVMRRRESKAINVSLTHLNRTLVRMQNGQLDESDRRQGTLNMVLWESLREDCGVTMIFCIHPDRRWATAARSTLQMALRCRKIARQKRVRRIEAVGGSDEIAALREQASALTDAHQQAMSERLVKEEELQRTTEMMNEIKHLYEAKSRDYDTLRAQIESGEPPMSSRSLANSSDDPGRRQLEADLDRKNHLLQGIVSQLQSLQQQLQHQDGGGSRGSRGSSPAASSQALPWWSDELRERQRLGESEYTESLRRTATDSTASTSEDWARQTQPSRAHHYRSSNEQRLQELLEALRQQDASEAGTSTAAPTSPTSSAFLVGLPGASPSPQGTSTTGDPDFSHGGRSMQSSRQSSRANCGLASEDTVLFSSREPGSGSPTDGCSGRVLCPGQVPWKQDATSGCSTPLRTSASPSASPPPSVSRVFCDRAPRHLQARQESRPRLVQATQRGTPVTVVRVPSPQVPACPTVVVATPGVPVQSPAIAAISFAPVITGPGGVCSPVVIAPAPPPPPGKVVQATPVISMSPRCQSAGQTRTERALAQLSATPGNGSLEDPAVLDGVLGHLWRLTLQGQIEANLKSQCLDAGLRAMKFPGSMHGRITKLRRDGARLIAELASKDPALKDEVVAKGALPLAVGALQDLFTVASGHQAPERLEGRPPDNGKGKLPERYTENQLAADACSACFRLLAVLCQRNLSHQTAIRALGGVEAALRCLTVPALRAGAPSAVHGCWLVMALCHKNVENQDLVRTLGGVPTLLELLEEETSSMACGGLDTTRVVEASSATLCAYVTGCLASVAEGNAENQHALHKAGAMPLVLQTLESCLQSPHVVSNACISVAHMAHRHEPSQHVAKAQGGARQVLDALAAYRGHGAVQGNVCRAIAVLTENCPTNQAAFLAERLPDATVEMEAVGLLLQALASATKDEYLATTACWALANLAAGNPEATERVRACQGPKVLMTALEHLAREERACEYLCRLLAEIARGDSPAARDNRQELQSLGAPAAVAFMAKHHAQTQGFVLVRARDALMQLQGQPASGLGPTHGGA